MIEPEYTADTAPIAELGKRLDAEVAELFEGLPRDYQRLVAAALEHEE